MGRAGFGALFAYKDGVIDIGYLQRHVHQAFRVADLMMIAVEFIGIKGDERGVELGEDMHLTIQCVAPETHPILRMLVIDSIVNRIFLRPRTHQVRHYLIQFRTRGVKREIACVGHYARVDAGGYSFAES